MEICQRALYPQITPVAVLLCHPDNQLLNFPRDSRPARSTPRTPVILAGDEPAMPIQQRCRSKNRRDILKQLPSEQHSLRRQPAALLGSETKPVIAD
jgi:hypothetical protein